MTTTFFDAPDQLPGAAGAWLRGADTIPDNAQWLPHPAHRPARTTHLALGLVGAAACLLLAVWLPSPWSAMTFVLAICIAIASREWHRANTRALPGSGRHGLLLLPHQAVYRVGTACAVVQRADITGVERRLRTNRTVVGAFILAGRTGRGALPSPIPGDATIDRMRAWLQATSANPTGSGPTEA